MRRLPMGKRLVLQFFGWFSSSFSAGFRFRLPQTCLFVRWTFGAEGVASERKEKLTQNESPLKCGASPITFMMLKQATTATTIGCLVVLLVCVFPPRDAIQTKEPRPRGFLFAEHIDRADVTFNPSTKSGTFTRVEVSLGRLLAEICAVSAATGLAICLLVLRQYSTQGTENQVQELVEEERT